MGVHGLWKLIEPVGKIVPLEGMANKVLAIDVSIWLHQAIKGMHDSHGAPLAVAHLLILFHRLCKLLYYKIKPVFVFDGGVPALKRETMLKRRKFQAAARSEALKVREKLLKNVLKHEAVNQILLHGQPSEIIGLSSLALPGSSTEEELFKLPPVLEEQSEENSDDEDEVTFTEDIYSVDVTGEDFKSLPPEVRHEILMQLIETRKHASWKLLNSMPTGGDNFSDFQMKRLLKRRAIQASLEEVSKEMVRGSMTLKDLEDLLTSNNCPLGCEDILPSKRIAQNEETRYLFIKKGTASDMQQEKETSDDKNQAESVCDFPLEHCLDDHIKAFAEGEDAVTTFEDSTEHGLTQQEIYEIIKMEKCPKNQEKIALPSVPQTPAIKQEILTADDISENTSAGEVKDEEVGSVEEKSESEKCSELLTDICVNETRNVLEDETERKVNITVEIYDVSEKNLKSTVNSETIEVFQSNVVNEPFYPQEFTSAVKGESSITTNSERSSQPEVSVPNEDLCSDKKVVEAKLSKTPLEPISNKSSDDSDSDFIPVESEVTGHESKVCGITEKSAADSIEVFIEKGMGANGEDIFADVFSDRSKSINSEKSEKSSKFVEHSENVNDIISSNILTESHLKELRNFIANEYVDLVQEQGKQERFAQNVSDQMSLDAQELLRLFGVPYIVAPMEAEAQCAVLDIIGLTNGTITDDSDIWLFGGKVVYRNFFNQKKHVQQYKSEDIERSFKLSRQDLIKMAMLVGSDYTPGLEGIGPVTALEILGAFPNVKNEETLSGLKSFRDWFIGSSETNSVRRSLRKKIKITKISKDFPSEAVLHAYLHPMVDDSKEPFSWAKPNIILLQNYTKLKFGWTTEKFNELLMPVIKKMADNKRENVLENYFSSMPRNCFLEGSLSKRVQNAVRQLGGETSNLILDKTDAVEPYKKKPKRTKKLQSHTDESSKPRKILKGNDAGIPQKLAMEKVFEERKKTAIKIFKTAKKRIKKNTPAVIKNEINLSESDSESN